MEYLSYFKLALTDFIAQHHPDKIEDKAFIEERSGLAEEEFERCSHMGMTVSESKHEATKILYRGLWFSPFDMVKEIVELYFDIDEEERHQFIMQMLEYTRDDFKKFLEHINDNNEDGEDYTKLYYTIIGSIKLYLEKNGLQ